MFQRGSFGARAISITTIVTTHAANQSSNPQTVSIGKQINQKDDDLIVVTWNASGYRHKYVPVFR